MLVLLTSLVWRDLQRRVGLLAMAIGLQDLLCVLLVIRPGKHRVFFLQNGGVFGDFACAE